MFVSLLKSSNNLQHKVAYMRGENSDSKRHLSLNHELSHNCLSYEENDIQCPIS